MTTPGAPWGMVPPNQDESILYGDRLTLDHVHGRRHEYVYLAADIFTDNAISELPIRNATFSWGINKPGTFSGDVQVSNFPRVRDYFDATVPAKTVVYIIRDGVPIWGGIIWKRSFDAGARVVKIEADTWDSYMYHRILDKDWMFFNDPDWLPNTTNRYDGVEQIEVFRMLWKYMSLGATNNIAVTLGNQVSPIKRGVLFKGTQYETYGKHLEDFAKKTDGFEWFATVISSGDGTRIERRIEFAYPKFGRPWQESNLIWEYPGTMTSYNWESDADKAATVAYVIGKGDEGLKPVVIRQNEERIARGFLRIDQKFEHSTVFDAEILKSHAAKYLTAYDPPIHSVGVTIHPRLPVEVGSYFVGDEVRLIIDDDLFLGANVDERDLIARITSLSVSQNDEGLENVTPELEIVSRALNIIDAEDRNADLVPDGYTGPAINPPEVQPELPPDGSTEPDALRGYPSARLWKTPWRRGMDSLRRAQARGEDPWR